MNFMSIWTMPGLPVIERLRRTRDWASRTIARHLPRRIRYWVTMQEIGTATRTSPDVPDTKLDWILEHLDAPKNVT